MNISPQNLAATLDRFATKLLALAAILLLVACDRGAVNPSSAAPVATVPTNAAPPSPKFVPLANMVLIKAGTYMRIKFPVTITRDFWIGKYEVTQAEWERAMGKNPSNFPDPARPVEKISFNDAQAYCAVVTKTERDAGRLPGNWEYRLPTEGEWEYACRAGSTNLYSFGNDPASAAQYAWTTENAEATTHPVGQKQPNAWGLYDMHGNVWEWCSDWFEPYPARAETDPVGPAESKYKVFRGGGWNNEINMARCSNRFMMGAGTGIHFVGLRIVLAQTSP
jgi:formylglycine-generating enzyme required for sulfatase activity